MARTGGKARMAAAATEEDALRVTVDQLKVLSDPSRLQILVLLFDGEKTLSQLAQAMNIAPATVHHHLAQLLKARLISQTRTEARGNLLEKYYTLASGGIDSRAVWSRLADREKVTYRLAVLGMLKGLINQAIRTMRRRGTVEWAVGSVHLYRLPWRADVLQQVDEILAGARDRLRKLHDRYEDDPEDKVTLVLTTLPTG